MIEASLIIGIFVVSISTLLVGLATLIVGIFSLRSARRSLGLAENRMEYLREEQERLAFLREERRTLVEELKQERQKRLEAQQNADHLGWEEHKGLPEVQQEGPQLGQERAMEPPQVVSETGSTTDAADEERPGEISNPGAEGRIGDAYGEDSDAEARGKGEPAVPPKEVRQGTTDDRRLEARDGAAEDAHEPQKGPMRRPQEDTEHRKNMLARAMSHLRHR